MLTKLAAARANAAVGAMDEAQLQAIERACDAVLKGRQRDQFAVDLYQGGAGTSANMNANEVLANVGLELTGKRRATTSVLDPHDHLNMSQSTNDAYPTALKLAFLRGNDRLVPEVRKLAAAFRAKAEASITTLKMGRTEMQDAVPMTVGQELHAFAATLGRRGAEPARRRARALRRQHGRHRDRHRPERAERLREEVRQRASRASPGSRSSPPPT